MQPDNPISFSISLPYDSFQVPERRLPAVRSRNQRITGVLVVALVFAAGLRLFLSAVAPVGDPTEGRYAQIAHNMVVTQDWVTPQVWVDEAHVPFLGKPPLFFWTAALSIESLGANEFAARLPSFVAAGALLVLMFFVLSIYLDRETAVLATLITATSGLFFFLAGSVVLDMHLTVFVAGAYFAYLAFVLEGDERIRKRWSLLIFVLLAGGFLTKGPVALILFGLPILAWTTLRKKWHLLRHHSWAAGLPLFLLLVAPWFVAAEIRNAGFLHYFFINENLLRYISPNYGDLYGSGHIYPRGSAVVMFVAAALPWSLIALWIFSKRGMHQFKTMMRDDVSSFLFFGFAVNVAFWCFSRQLLVTYMLPLIPIFAAWLASDMRTKNPIRNQRRSARLAIGAAALWCVVLVLAMPVVAESSTRDIVKRAGAVARHLGISNEIVFARRTPQSAYFYASGKVLAHPKEKVGATVRRTVISGEPRLLAIPDAAVDDIPNSLKTSLRQVDSAAGWRLFVTVPATDDQ